MPDLYAELAAVAQQLIDQFGGPCQLQVFATPPTNNTTPWKPLPGAVGSTLVPSRMAILPKTRPGQEPVRYADGTTQRVGDEEVYIGPEVAIVPDVSMSVVKVDGSVWRIKAATPLSPAGIACLYTCWIQK